MLSTVYCSENGVYILFTYIYTIKIYLLYLYTFVSNMRLEKNKQFWLVRPDANDFRHDNILYNH